IDENGYLITVENVINGSFVRINPDNLQVINKIPLSKTPCNVMHHDSFYYIDTNMNNSIMVYDKNMSLISEIDNTALSPRDMLIIQNTLIVASAANNKLLFFQINSLTNYTLVNSIQTTGTSPHGLTYVNDTYFYVVSFVSNTVYSYSKIQPSSTNWTEALYINSTTNGLGTHMTIDDCDRRWLSIAEYGIRIYDLDGTHLADWTITTMPFDLLILNNYVMIITLIFNNTMIRVDPQYQCN
ncbi:unnamed protein product, partial [Didymodactylos carnosus]